MLFIHYAAIGEVSDIKRNGLAVSRLEKYRKRGVYAMPLVAGIPPKVQNLWKKVFRGSRKRARRTLPIIFRIPDDELIWFVDDF